MDATANALPDFHSHPALDVLAEAIWNASAHQRQAQFHAWSRCPTRTAPYGTADPGGSGVHEWCLSAGCLDLHHELISRVLTKLKGLGSAGRNVADFGAYVYGVTRRELVELGRRQRCAQGFPAKPTRPDGVPSRINAELAARPDGAWLTTLFRIMRSYPFSLHHVPGRWPYAGFAEEKTRFVGGRGVGPDEVRHDVNQVLSTATATAGGAWVYANLTLPLTASGASEELPWERAADATDNVEATLARLLRAAYLRHRRAGRSPEDAFGSAAQEVAGHAPLAETAEVRAALSDLESDL